MPHTLDQFVDEFRPYLQKHSMAFILPALVDIYFNLDDNDRNLLLGTRCRPKKDSRNFIKAFIAALRAHALGKCSGHAADPRASVRAEAGSDRASPTTTTSSSLAPALTHSNTASTESAQTMPDYPELTGPIVFNEQIAGPLVFNEQATEPIVANEQATEPIVFNEQATEPIVANEQATEPIVANEQATEPIVANEQAIGPPILATPLAPTTSAVEPVQYSFANILQGLVKDWSAGGGKRLPPLILVLYICHRVDNFFAFEGLRSAYERSKDDRVVEALLGPWERKFQVVQ